MIITNIVKGKSDSSFIFIDGVYWFSVDEEVILKNGLKVGAEVDKELVEKIKSEANFHKAKEKALRLLSYRSHSKKELVEKIKRKYDETSAKEAGEKMEKLGFVDDKKFAIEYARYFFNKFYSIKRVQFELGKRGIEKDIIEEVIESTSVDEVEQIVNLIKKKYSKKMNSYETTRKVSMTLSNAGYNLEDIRSGMRIYRELNKDN